MVDIFFVLKKKLFMLENNTVTDQLDNSNAPAPAYTDLKSQKAFEKGLLEKTAKQTGDIILYDNRLVLYKSEADVMMYVIGGADENEVMLYNVVLCLRDSLHLLFKYFLLPATHLNFGTNGVRQSVDKRTIIENYDQVALAVDEIVDDGIILETDPTIIVQRARSFGEWLPKKKVKRVIELEFWMDKFREGLLAWGLTARPNQVYILSI
ncbi:putative coatomer subunit zeta [Glarea lozoyensis 74030]|uniref:Coatomer subunit zeta n=1 Tax=Glarea lozoyensis (strain ATCC 74030 / MF5533) TaxID=1104152 RepID=H0EF96_GLAL7|nr:putative coatomer subunit zeta [Glarea lozoyensis 74030]